MWLTSRDLEGALPASAREVADVTGAGDTVIATMALALAAGGTLAEAGPFGQRGRRRGRRQVRGRDRDPTGAATAAQ
jgi:sugar/nucleoside kinase (ribokinase family)